MILRKLLTSTSMLLMLMFLSMTGCTPKEKEKTYSLAGNWIYSGKSDGPNYPKDKALFTLDAEGKGEIELNATGIVANVSVYKKLSKNNYYVLQFNIKGSELLYLMVEVTEKMMLCALAADASKDPVAAEDVPNLDGIFANRV